jgi:hypothetical protein
MPLSANSCVKSSQIRPDKTDKLREGMAFLFACLQSMFLMVSPFWAGSGKRCLSNFPIPVNREGVVKCFCYSIIVEYKLLYFGLYCNIINYN